MSASPEVTACTSWDISGRYKRTGSNAWSRVGTQNEQYENGAKNRHQPNQCRLRQDLPKRVRAAHCNSDAGADIQNRQAAHKRP
jgi:hypothetical protein